MDCTIYEWEGGHDPLDRRIRLRRSLKRAFPVIVDDRFRAMLRALNHSANDRD
ncbi:MAG: hypothetical protein ACEQR8_06145 [Cypionkella sp.]